VKVWERRVCESCAALLRQETRLYPYEYILALGILGNFAFAAVLSAINWKRMGDKVRMRNAILLAVLGVGWLVFMVAKDVKGGGCVVNIIGSLVAAQGLKEGWAEHKKAQGARANLLWPLLIGVFGGLAAGMGIAFGLELAGYEG
jgi:hypothetical protein